MTNQQQAEDTARALAEKEANAAAITYTDQYSKASDEDQSIAFQSYRQGYLDKGYLAASAQQGWVSVSGIAGRNPEKSGEYIVCVQYEGYEPIVTSDLYSVNLHEFRNHGSAVKSWISLPLPPTP